MKLGTLFIIFPSAGGSVAHATFDVPGVGQVKVEQALSQELCDAVVAEATAALRGKLKMAFDDVVLETQ